ncbi:RNA-binding protein Nova-1 [Clonorchis sinensis]|uniref:RNA-binding protein Nova-1 n=1 Tax=Clonorchis sinensis TaxID=79923 RepID=A0A8T1MLL7_CLOSI|nr:RNA-binding protein Nova-1 [Clonorchis sinensis]
MTKESDGCLPDVEHEDVVSQSIRNDFQGLMHERATDSATQKQAKSNVHFKILVPSIAAGAIIGKGGEAITDIQNKTSAKVKMSKANDFYPGTTERVCLIVGTIDSILRVFQYISEKIYEKPESILRSTNKGGRMPAERHKQVKILVPNSTAGIIIGKGGSFIKEVKESTGVFIQVSQKSKELNLAERCVTVAGELPQTFEAVKQLLFKIADDPQSSSCPNISYAEVPRPVASAYPTGSPYALVLGSSFGINNCSLPSAGSDQLMTGGQTNPGSNTTGFPPGKLGSFSSVSPTGSTPTPAPVFGSSPPSAFAAAMAAMSAASPFSPGNTGGRATSILSSHTTSRALTGRGGATGHHSNSHSQPVHPASQSLLGSVTTHLGPGGSPAYGSPASVNSGSSSGSTIGLEVVRNILRSAGYSDVATEEIANAMHVLNLYGFISMSSLTGCAAGASPLSNAVNNGHFTMGTSPLSNLGGSLSGYVSGGPQSPGFSTEVGSHLRGVRNMGSGSAPNQTYHQSTNAYQHHYSSRCSSTTTAQLAHPQANACSPVCSSSLSTSLAKDTKSLDPLIGLPPVTCENSSTVQTSDCGVDLYTSLPSGEPGRISSPTRSPILNARSLSPNLVSSIPTETPSTTEPLIGHEYLHRINDNALSLKLKHEGNSTTANGGNCSSTTNGGHMWSLSRQPMSSSKSSPSST